MIVYYHSAWYATRAWELSSLHAVDRRVEPEGADCSAGDEEDQEDDGESVHVSVSTTRGSRTR